MGITFTNLSSHFQSKEYNYDSDKETDIALNKQIKHRKTYFRFGGTSLVFITKKKVNCKSKMICSLMYTIFTIS